MGGGAACAGSTGCAVGVIFHFLPGWEAVRPPAPAPGWKAQCAPRATRWRHGLGNGFPGRREEPGQGRGRSLEARGRPPEAGPACCPAGASFRARGAQAEAPWGRAGTSELKPSTRGSLAETASCGFWGHTDPSVVSGHLPTAGRGRLGLLRPGEARRHPELSRGMCACSGQRAGAPHAWTPDGSRGRMRAWGRGKGACPLSHRLGCLWLQGTGNLINSGISYEDLTDSRRPPAAQRPRPFPSSRAPSAACWHFGGAGVR